MGSVQETPLQANSEVSPSSNNNTINMSTSNDTSFKSPVIETTDNVQNSSGELASSADDSINKDMNISAASDGHIEKSATNIRKDSITQKTSVIPALSRIARPCSGHQKPALPPPTPAKSELFLLLLIACCLIENLRFC